MFVNAECAIVQWHCHGIALFRVDSASVRKFVRVTDQRDEPNLRRRRQDQQPQGPDARDPRAAVPRAANPGPVRPSPRPTIPPPPRPGPPPPTTVGPRPPTPPTYQPPLAWSAQPDAPQRRAPARGPERTSREASPHVRPSQQPSGQPAVRRSQPPAVQPHVAPVQRNERYAPTQTPEPVPAAGRGGSRPAAGAPPKSVKPASGKPVKANSTKAKSRPASSATKPKRKRRILTFRHLLSLLLVIVLTAVVAAVGGLIYYDGKLHRVNALNFSGRIAQTPGMNWLVVGTDSRDGLTAAQRRKYSTGPDEGGARTDTIMLISKPLHGRTAIISIPRDLFVQIPDGYGQHKINAAFNMGGPQLLVRTIESISGIHIDHYAEIGFGGFANVVDAIGGIHVCLKEPLRDPKAGLRLKAGCQDLNGRQALGLVRTRDFPNADLQRVINQRKVFAALMDKATSPGVLLNPFRLLPFVNGIVDSLTVDTNDHSWNLLALAWSLRGHPVMATVPTGGDVWSDDGESLSVGDNTTEFFDRLAKGQAVDPKAFDDESQAAVG